MSGCEKCWEDSGGNAERYHELIKTRECTQEEQTGRGTPPIICEGCGGEINPDYGKCLRCE